MRIAGLQKLSLVDFPGHVSSAVFIQGCNFKCGYCHNPDLVTLDKKFDCSEEEVMEHVSRRKKFIEGIVLTGGEPTLYEDLPGLAERLKDMGFKIKLDTNGSNPAQIENLIRNRLLDYIAVDIKTSFSKYNKVTDLPDIEETISESIWCVMLSTVPYEFRTTCVPGIVEEEDLREIGQIVKGAKKYCLQQFQPNITYDESYQEITPYTKDQLNKFRDTISEFVEEVEVRGV